MKVREYQQESLQKAFLLFNFREPNWQNLHSINGCLTLQITCWCTVVQAGNFNNSSTSYLLGILPPIQLLLHIYNLTPLSSCATVMRKDKWLLSCIYFYDVYYQQEQKGIYVKQQKIALLFYVTSLPHTMLSFVSFLHFLTLYEHFNPLQLNPRQDNSVSLERVFPKELNK